MSNGTKIDPVAEQVRVMESWRGGMAPPCEIPCGVIPEEVRAGVVIHYATQDITATWVDRDGPNQTKAHALRLAPMEPAPTEHGG